MYRGLFAIFAGVNIMKYHGKNERTITKHLGSVPVGRKVVSAEPFGNGHINDTLKVTNEKGEIKYVLQRINHLIFTNVDMLQNNIHVVTTHIRKKLEEKVKRISTVRY